MKISSEYDKISKVYKSDLFQMNSVKDVEINEQIKDCAYLSGYEPVQVDISAEGMEQYRNLIKQNTMKGEEDKKWDNFTVYNLELLTDHNVEFSARINEIDQGKENHTIKDRANSILEAYASLYAEIVEGYDKGTRCVCIGTVGAAEDKPLTKEEDLAKLKEAYENHARTFEKLFKIEQENQKSLEKDIRGSIWEKKSSKAQMYLQELDRKKEDSEYIPSNISEHILDAGKSFLSGVFSLNSIDRKSVMDIIASINVW